MSIKPSILFANDHRHSPPRRLARRQPLPAATGGFARQLVGEDRPRLLPEELTRLGKMLTRFPDTPVALDHCGFAGFTDGPPWNSAKPLWQLAEHQNLHLKVTANVLDAAGSGECQQHISQQNLLTTLTRHFGANRLMWGSDYPQVHNRPYSDLATLARAAASELTKPEQNDFMGGAALGF